jgi:hypothetical protein
MQRQDSKKSILCSSDGFAVVEAIFVFPVMFMVFFALVLLAFYLPQRAMLQRSTQHAATVIAVELSDTWVYYDVESQTYGRYESHSALRDAKGGVYVSLFNSIFGGNEGDAVTTVMKVDETENIPIIQNGDLSVAYKINNYVIYKEVVVTAKRSIGVPVDFSFIEFPDTIDLIVTSKSVVQNGDEFVRNIDMAVHFVKWAEEKYPKVGKVFDKIKEAGKKISGFFGV